ncbi:MAG: LamG-like jellyroll fold domain-containing protein [Chloroflexota bacterium]|jgi:hypothetical protein|nr:hypothetical protein [Chloroflexota bacterium]
MQQSQIGEGIVGTNTQKTSFYWGAMPAKRWVHLAGTRDGAQLRLYVDGVEVCNQPLSGNIPIDGNPVNRRGRRK